MTDERWPNGSVRSWRGVLHERRLDKADFVFDDDAEDPFREAEVTRRLHMLRGVFMAQAAEIEELLVMLAERLPAMRKHRRRSAGSLLIELEKLTHDESLADQFNHLTWLLKRRNQLVHATVSVGYSYVRSTGSRDSVIAVLHPIRTGDVPWELAPRLNEDDPSTADEDPWALDRATGSASATPVLPPQDDVDEFELERDLRRAHVTVQSAVLIYQHFSSAH